MNETPAEESRDTAAVDTGSGPDIKPAKSVSGLEINLGDFTRTQGLLKSLRLMLNNQIVVPVEEIAGAVSEAGRKFKIGEVEQANQDVGRLYSAFRQKISQWEAQARSLEQQMRLQTAKNPKAYSIDTMNRMKSEQTAVRTRIRTTDVQFRRLTQGLEQAFIIFQRQAANATSETPSEETAGFLVPFKAATLADRPAIIQEWFEIESVLKVQISGDTKAGYRVRFDPKPLPDRLYYLTSSGEVLRLQELGELVRCENLETSQTIEVTLKEFVKHVQKGVWLLKPRS